MACGLSDLTEDTHGADAFLIAFGEFMDEADVHSSLESSALALNVA